MSAILNDLHHFAATILLAVGALLPIVDPLGGAPIYLALTAGLTSEERTRVAKAAQVTPMESSRYLAEILGSPVYLKCENLQRTGSYKIRGAYNLLSQLTPEERARGVVAASAGNHAQGVAVAAKSLGIKARIYMPLGVALPKLAATRSHGAEVVLHGHNVDEALAEAKRYADESGAVFVHPFDDVDVVAGQGTVGLEILEQVPDVEKAMVASGIILIKYWLEVGPDEQTRRIEGRIHDPRKVWKLSDMDLKSYSRWYDYSRARDAMFAATDSPWAPWHIAHTNSKKRGRLNIISHLLSQVPYEPLPKKDVKLPRRQRPGDYQEKDHSPRYIPAPF